MTERHRRQRWVLAAALLAAMLAGGAARADTVTLTDGTVREGTIVEEDATTVTLEVRLGSMKGRVVIERSRIRSIEKKDLAPDPVEAGAAPMRADARGKQGREAADAWVKLGDYYALKVGFTSEAQAAYVNAVAADPDHEAARKRLGHVKTDQGWQAVDAERRAQGLVPLDDELWVRPAERAWIIDQRRDAGEDLSIAPRKDEPDKFTQRDIEAALRQKRAEQAYRERERLRLEYGESLLSRYGYFAPGDGLYIGGSGYTPYYVDGVGIASGDDSFFVGTVSTEPYYHARRSYGPGYGYGSGSGFVYTDGGRGSAASNFRRSFGYSPGIVAGNFAFGTNLSNFGPYYGGYGYGGYGSGYSSGSYGGYGIHLNGGSKKFKYSINIGGFSGSSSFGSSSGFGF